MSKLSNIRNEIPATIFIVLFTINVFGQGSGGFDLKTTPSVDFTFNTFGKYLNGIVMPRVLELKVDVTGTQWDLYIGATTTTPGEWNVTNTYSNTGTYPIPVGLLEARVYNINNTQQTGGSFFPLTDIATPTYLIGTASNDSTVDCTDPIPIGTNEPGDYISSPECYKFRVDLKIKPGLNYRPGLYNLRVDFIIIADL